MIFNYLGEYFFQVWTVDTASDGKPYFANFRDNSLISSPMLAQQVDEHEAIQSFSVTEEEYCSTLIDVTVRDALRVYSGAFKPGVKFKVRWGYKNNAMYESLLSKIKFWSNDSIEDEEHNRGGGMDDSLEKGIPCSVVSFPAGTISNGVHIFTVQMRGGLAWHFRQEYKKYTNSTYKNVITEEAKKYGTKEVIINFNGMEKEFGAKLPLVRDNKSFIEFLREIAIEENLYLAYNFEGDKTCLVMCDWEKFNTTTNNVVKARGSKGVCHYIDMYGKNSNIIEISYHTNPSAFGSTAFPSVGTDGKPTMTFTASPTETAYIWTLKSIEDIKEELKRQGKSIQEIESIVSRIQKLIAVSDLYDNDGNIQKEFQNFFQRKAYTTAPELGMFEVEVKVIPDPKYRVGDKVFLGPTSKQNLQLSQLPSVLYSWTGKASPLYYRIAKQNWTHDASGVNQTLTLKR